MDKDTNNLLRAIIRRAIATQNYYTTVILDSVKVTFAPKRDANGKVMQKALVIGESEYKVMNGEDKTDFNSIRYDQAFRVLNNFFFSTSSPVLKQAFKYISINGNRVDAVLEDYNNVRIYDCQKSLHLFDEFYSLFNSFAYNTQKNVVEFNFDLEQLNQKINEGIKNRNGVFTNYDFKPLLQIMQRDLEKWETRTLNRKTIPDNNNTILNYLDTYALLEYYMFRKNINSYFFKNVNRPLYKQVPKKLLLQEALDSQIFPMMQGEQSKAVFKNPMAENVCSKKLTHDMAKAFTSDLASDPNVMKDIPGLLNTMLAQHSSKYASHTYVPGFSISALDIQPVLDEKTGKTKYRFDIKTCDTPLNFAVKNDASEHTQRYASYHQDILDAKNSTPISLFDNEQIKTKRMP